jgi:hypothetical protein
MDTECKTASLPFMGAVAVKDGRDFESVRVRFFYTALLIPDVAFKPIRQSGND